MKDAITEFKGEYRWLSNFWPCLIIKGDYTYPSTENAYQASKFTETNRVFFTTCSPAKSKERGSKLLALPDNWEAKKIEIMRVLIRQKFRVGTFNAELLIKTGDCLIVEGNSWGDTFWGVCDGKGENHLGRILMTQRENLKADCKSTTE